MVEGEQQGPVLVGTFFSRCTAYLQIWNSASYTAVLLFSLIRE